MLKFKEGKKLGVIVVVAAFLCSPCAAAQQKAFTLEQVMSSPFPDWLIAAPAGGKVAWVFNASGARNIWVAEPAAGSGGYKARAVTSYSEDDGQDVGELSWAPDASAIAYTRGGDFENGGTYPNPRSFTAGVEQAVWIVTLGDGAPRRLGEGHSPAVSPKGDSVAFIYKNQVWQAKLTGSEKAAQLI